MSDPDDGPDGHGAGDPDADTGPSAEAGAGPDTDAVPAADGEADDESQWQFSLQDIEDRETEREAAAEAERRRSEPLEAGDPSLENAVFVLLGALFALFVISRLFGL